MARCIYCKKNHQEVGFSKREHVIPEFFGVYENTPTLHGLVCDVCNGDVFSPLESKFKEDTLEGIRYQQMCNMTGSSQVRIRNEKAVPKFSSGIGDKFFDEVFPFLDWQDNEWKVVLLPQIRIKQAGGGFHVFLIDRLKDISAGKRKKIKKQLGRVEPKDVSIFVPGDSEDDERMDDAIAFVRELGIPYKEKSRSFAKVADKAGDVPNGEFVVEVSCTIDSEYGRVIAKIAFNYLAYCAQEAGNAELLFDPTFDKLRKYVSGEIELPVKDVIVDVRPETVLWDEKKKGMRFVGHIITFRAVGERIIAELSFMGGMTYEVLLGDVPEGLDTSSFGCGHLFLPLDRQIRRLTANKEKGLKDESEGFGLHLLN